MMSLFDSLNHASIPDEATIKDRNFQYKRL